jgi:hypothetical protein
MSERSGASSYRVCHRSQSAAIAVTRATQTRKQKRKKTAQLAEQVLLHSLLVPHPNSTPSAVTHSHSHSLSLAHSHTQSRAHGPPCITYNARNARNARNATRLESVSFLLPLRARETRTGEQPHSTSLVVRHTLEETLLDSCLSLCTHTLSFSLVVFLFLFFCESVLIMADTPGESETLRTQKRTTGRIHQVVKCGIVGDGTVGLYLLSGSCLSVFLLDCSPLAFCFLLFALPFLLWGWVFSFLSLSLSRIGFPFVVHGVLSLFESSVSPAPILSSISNF